MNISGIDPKPRIRLAEAIDVDISDDINGRPCSCVSENPLQIGLNCHVRGLMAIENPSPSVIGQVP